MKPVLQLAACAALAVGVAGCDATYIQQPGGGFGPPKVVLETPGGDYPLYTPPAMPGSEANLAAPPGFFAATPANLPSPASRGGGWQDGTYDGTATLLDSAEGNCAFNFAMTNLHLNNGRVRFSQFHGRVGSDGGVRMADGAQNWMLGHFTGGYFRGTYTNRWCTYALALDRVGP